ncbi:hypothetical protein [Clostridium haemolyticum]|uniref:Peptidase S1 domain-containing protein n=1 Tax=Clostridium haemolyticum NCTC 9693 TaxID=1443114 RepID=A0ABR4TD66_CLOHA|nr:hypothetical protein [Clostridium haemolyticum]KEI15220.1 hypothetical protein Z960_01175 [Clostridium haemolyticum NCTC 9693]
MQNEFCKYCKQSYCIDEKISYICQNEYEYFFSKPNVVGVGLGYKISNGFNTNKKCIKVFVSRKVPKNQISCNYMIPSNYKNIETDVIESGIIRAISLKDRVRPVTAGYSIGPLTKIYGGSMGCLLTDGVDYYILSCNHVLAYFGEVSLNTPILQPSVIDGGKKESDIFAILSKYIPIKFESTFSHPTNYVDCAVAKVINKSLVSSSITLIGKPKGLIIPRLNEPVQKVGKSTGLTVGKILAIDCSTKVLFSNGKSGVFKKQIATNLLVKGGDSGSVMLDYNNNIIGLLISGTDTISIANSIQNVLDILKLRLVTN